MGIPAEFRSMHYNEIYTAWVVPRGFSQNYPNNERKKMTQQEVMEALDKAGIDYEFIEEFDGSMHIIVKFEEVKND